MRLWDSPWDHRSRGYPVACQLDAEPDEHDPGDAFEPALEGPFPGQCGQLRYQKHHGTKPYRIIPTLGIIDRHLPNLSYRLM